MLGCRSEPFIKWAAEGAVKCDLSQSILQRDEMRQFSGICQYPSKRTGFSVNQGGTADMFIRP